MAVWQKCGGRGRGGFTIVELLVAAVIMLIGVLAVVAVARKSVALEEEDHHIRQARMIIMTMFEDVFDHRNYPNNYGPFSIKPGATSFDTVMFFVPLDTRSFRTDTLMGEMYLHVRNDSVMANGVKVYTNIVRAAITWDEIDGTRDSVVLKKLLADTE